MASSDFLAMHVAMHLMASWSFYLVNFQAYTASPELRSYFKSTFVQQILFKHKFGWRNFGEFAEVFPCQHFPLYSIFINFSDLL